MTDLNELKEFCKTQLILEGISNYARFLQDMSSDNTEMSLEEIASILKDFLKTCTRELKVTDSIEEMWKALLKVGNEHGCFAVDENDFEDFLKKIAKWTKHFEKF